MDAVLAVLLTGAVLAALLLWKNERTLVIQRMRLDAIYAYGMQRTRTMASLSLEDALAQHRDIDALFARRLRSYNSVLYDPLAWTYRQAYPRSVGDEEAVS